MRHVNGKEDELIADLARRHDVGVDAVLTLRGALERGRGEQAQFSHSDLGGMGQWSSRGMIMVGDMFNTGLKARVDALCAELSALVREGAISTGPAHEGLPPGGNWWPDGCGTPRSSGSQNDTRYAYFPETRRLAIQCGETVELYDTGDHRIFGVSQQRSGGEDLRFTSQRGTVRLDELERVENVPARAPIAEPEARPERPRADAGQPSAGKASDDVFVHIERLHDLHRKGVLDATEFAAKKRELLARI